MDRVVICISPNAGSGRDRDTIPNLVQCLQRAGKDVVVNTEIRAIRDACKDLPDNTSLQAVVAAGGDGTLSLVADVLQPGIPILPFPLGTENLLARHFGYGRDVSKAANAILTDRHHVMDAGRANGRLFLAMASCGFDAEVVREMQQSRRGHISRFSYLKPVFDAVRHYRYPQIQVRPTTEAVLAADMTCYWAMAFNLPVYGGGFQIASEAVSNDGLLDFVGLPRGSRISTIGYAASAYCGRLSRSQGVQFTKGSQWRWESETPVPYQLDGDYHGQLPVTIETLPARITLVSPVND